MLPRDGTLEISEGSSQTMVKKGKESRRQNDKVGEPD